MKLCSESSIVSRNTLTEHNYVYNMADATIRLDEEGEVVRMVNKEGDPEILKIMDAKDLKGNLEKESDPDFDYYTNLTEEEIAKEFQKLSPADKIRYNEWFDFHTTYQ